jgi:predicted anti-sigma-YlaC factor YlaD
VTCEDVREALSADLDGESGLQPRAALDVHLLDCPDCAAWADAAHAITRRVRLGAAQDVPDVTARVLAAWNAPTDRVRRYPWWRGGLTARIVLALLAIAQFTVTFPQLWLGHDADTATHPAHELGSLGAAFAVGLLAAALTPARARGLVPIVGAGGLALLATAIADLISRRTVISDELPHLIVVAGWLVLLGLAAVERRQPGRPTLQGVRAAIARWAGRADVEGLTPLSADPRERLMATDSAAALAGEPAQNAEEPATRDAMPRAVGEAR